MKYLIVFRHSTPLNTRYVKNFYIDYKKQTVEKLIFGDLNSAFLFPEEHILTKMVENHCGASSHLYHAIDFVSREDFKEYKLLKEII